MPLPVSAVLPGEKTGSIENAETNVETLIPNVMVLGVGDFGR